MLKLPPHSGGNAASVVTVAHQWNPDDWESFSLSLLQTRHGALNVHKIPANHLGDLGIDYYCTGEAVIYQCFAAEEPLDISTRADRQKKKITTDLKKLVDGQGDVSKLFMGVPVKKWILLAPIHDSKEVNLHCSKKTEDLRALGLSHLDADFEVCIQDQDAFPGAALNAAMATLTNISLSVSTPSADELSAWQAGSPNDCAGRAEYEIGFETSASDAIRLKWAYQLGLLELGREHSTNHPGMLLLDEPRQQSSSRVSFGKLLERAAARDRPDQQIIVSTSEDLDTLKEILTRIRCTETIIPGYVIKPVPSA